MRPSADQRTNCWNRLSSLPHVGLELSPSAWREVHLLGESPHLIAVPVQRCLGKPAAGGQSCLRSRKADTGRAASWCSPGASGANASQRQTQQRPDSGRRRLGCPRSSMQLPLSAVSARSIGRQTETAMLNPRPDYAAASAGPCCTRGRAMTGLSYTAARPSWTRGRATLRPRPGYAVQRTQPPT